MTSDSPQTSELSYAESQPTTRPQASNLVVIPTYNERDNIGKLIPRVLEQGHRGEYEVLVVDDGSPDGTGALVDELAGRDSRIHALHRTGKQGLGSAYVAGFRYALQHGYEYVFEMDADFSHDPADLPRLLAAARQSGVAVGARWIPGGGAPDWSLLRTFISRGGSVYARLILGIPVRDPTSGFKCFRADVLRRLNFGRVQSNGYAFQVELNYECTALGYRVTEVPIIFRDRQVGQSKMSSRIVFEAMVVVLMLRLRTLRARLRRRA